MTRFTLLLLLVYVPGIPLTAQWTAGVTASGMLDDNIFNNALNTSDVINEISLATGYDWESENRLIQAGYAGILDYYNLNPERSYQTHALSLQYWLLLDAEIESELRLGGTVTGRWNRATYDLYDYTRASLAGSVRHPLAERVLTQLGYSFHVSHFPQLPDLDFTEHVVTAKMNLAFPTLTTVILQGDLGVKTYIMPDATTTPSQRGMMRGRTSSTGEATAGATQLLLLLKVGQSLGEGTGISLAGQYQHSLRTDPRYLAWSDGLIADDEIFDDHYGYDGPAAIATLTHLGPWDTRLVLTGVYQDKFYTVRPALDLAGNSLGENRHDIRSSLTLTLEKRLPDLGIVFGMTADYIVNRSNDPFYDYHNLALSLRAGFEY